MQHQSFLAVLLLKEEKLHAKQSGVDFMPNKYFQLFTVYILITFCVADFLVILGFSTLVFLQGPCQKELYRALYKLVKAQQRSRGQIYKFYLPNCNKNGFYHSKQVRAFFLLPAHSSAVTSLIQPTLSQPSAPKLTSLQQVVETGILNSESRWFVLLFKVSCMLVDVSKRQESFPFREQVHSKPKYFSPVCSHVLDLLAYLQLTLIHNICHTTAKTH